MRDQRSWGSARAHGGGNHTNLDGGRYSHPLRPGISRFLNSAAKGDFMLFRKSSGETPEKKLGLFERMKKALGATKENLVSKIEAVLSSRASIDETVLDDLEGTLLAADLGV